MINIVVLASDNAGNSAQSTDIDLPVRYCLQTKRGQSDPLVYRGIASAAPAAPP
jgi:hypothetical protein